MTDQDEGEIAVESSRFERLQQLLQIGYWELSLPDYRLELSSGLRTLLQLPLDSRLDYDALTERLAGSGVSMLRRLINRLLRDPNCSIQDYLGATRRPDGEQQLLECRLAVERSVRGEAQRLYGAVSDVTAREQALESYQQDMLKLTLKLDNLVLQRTAELQQALDQLHRASLVRSRFLSYMSHEMRSPLHGILSFASMGEHRYRHLSPEQIRDYFGHIHNSGQRMLSWLNDLLDLSRLESNTLQLNLQPYMVGDLIEELSSCYRKRLVERHQRLHIEAGGELSVQIDCLRMRHALEIIFDYLLFESDPELPLLISWQPQAERAAISFEYGGESKSQQEIEQLLAEDPFRHREWSEDARSHFYKFRFNLAGRIIYAHRGQLNIIPRSGGNRLLLELPLTRINEGLSFV
ncbi:sensor histidine kinase [Ectothiorhodospiraceae bacterium BW-2]|nr:sensor histidine kinase [Ectothiorhodospiraceae bacterium BW-2]